MLEVLGAISTHTGCVIGIALNKIIYFFVNMQVFSKKTKFSSFFLYILADFILA